MKKFLLTLTAAGVLAVPAGVALAQTDTPDPSAPVPTCVDPDHDRVRDQAHDQGSQGLQNQERTQLRVQDETCDAGCTGDEVRNREQAELADGTGFEAQARQGDMSNHGYGRNSG